MMRRLVFIALCAACLLLTNCGVRATDEGRMRLPLADGRCEVVIEDALGDELPDYGGPLPRDAYASGLVCDVWRW